VKRHDPAPSLQPWARILIAAALMLALSLLAAASLPLSAPATPPESAQIEAEASEEEGEEPGSELEEETEEEEEEEEEFEAAHSVPLPSECILRSAQPSVAVQFGHGNVRLTLRYATQKPTKAGVVYWLKGSRGSLQLGSVSRHLGERGVIRLNSHLDEREMTKVRSAHAFLVSLDIPDAPAHCSRYLTLRLTAKHQLAKRETWSLPLERSRG
jgi:hypothetical protein